ncbi:TraE/TraK family type IV conjugative transfer system protein [Geoalkalibacter subterraneus]|uniref:TraE/TraK family type IV conjugative transfer system protein n=1 Tax=Geoalkalibacter subterraneus TaxID=483547 RepID=UPI00130E447C|nr:TraE/TraK family type IV conjugative transfer system protein [Geoalkalibacter subterraneus]
MIFKEYKKSFRAAVKELQWRRFADVAQLLIIIVLLFFLGTKSTVVTVVPPNLQEDAVIEKSGASENYKLAWGWFMADIIGNVTPKNVDFVRESISLYLSPTLYQEVRKSITEQARVLREDDIAVSFSPSSAQYQKSRNRVFITGETTTTGPFGDPRREVRTYEFVIEVKNYMPVFTLFDVYEGAAQLRPKAE